MVEKNKLLLDALKARFLKNMSRHPGIDWPAVQARLEGQPDKLRSLEEMEKTAGEPDVVDRDEKTGELLGGALFCDRRYDCVFVYHNGAQSYYAARGFRGVLKV